MTMADAMHGVMLGIGFAIGNVLSEVAARGLRWGWEKFGEMLTVIEYK